jgi:uncharacterized membrane protein YbhN (UPF0104 family)
MNNTKLNKTYNLLIKLVILIAAYGFIYKQLFIDRDIHKFKEFFQGQIHNNIYLKLGFIVLLMFLNWGIETLKWRFLIRKSEVISFFKAFQAVFAGITISSFTPNRVGEFFGRVFILKNTNPIKGIFISIIGSISQLFVTIIVGSTGSIIFLYNYIDFDSNIKFWMFSGFIVFVLALNVFLLLFFFNVGLVRDFINVVIKNKWRRIRTYMNVFAVYSKQELSKVLLLSFLRFLVFSLQFYFLLLIFGLNLPFFEAFMIIAVIFFVITAIPSIALSELGIRGSVALFFITTYFGSGASATYNLELSILTTTTVLWVINIFIPAIIGTGFVFRLRFIGKRSENAT